MGNFFSTNKRFMKDQETQTGRAAPMMVCSSSQTAGGPVINEIDDHSK